MEDKQLDFNQPFLSVRRFSSIVVSEKDDKRKTDNSLPTIPPLPSYRSELKSGPVRNPGTVPFVWEQSPGRRKDETKSQTQALERPPGIPKLPPGRILKVQLQAPDKVCEGLSVNGHEAGKVPCNSQSVSSAEENVTKFESSKDAMEDESSDSGDGDETYQDALDTLSRTESFFLNCSLSGLSGLDGPEVIPSGTFSTDTQTRDLMMGRFLPAAKAMASEAAQYAPWKQPVVREQPREAKKLVSGDKRPPIYCSRPNILPNYAEYNREEESDDENDGYDEPGNLSTKVCGLLPRFCLKSSFCLLNPVPGMSVRTRVPMSPVSRTYASSSSAGSCHETKNEGTRVATNEQSPIVGPRKTELLEYKNAVRNKSNQVPYQSNTQKWEGSSLHRHLQSSGISPRNELPQSIFCEEKGFLDIPKKAETDEINGFSSPKRCSNTFRELLADQSTKREIGSVSPMVEKTLFVDSVHRVVSPKLISFSSDVKGLPNSENKDFGITAKVTGLEETPSVDSLLTDIANLNIMDEEVKLLRKILNPADSSLPSFSCKSDQEMGMEMLKGFGQDQDLHQDSITSAKLKLSNNGYLDFKDQQQLTIVENIQSPHEIDSKCPLPPPLPKSPSDSWLWRTLPSMSSRNSSTLSYLGTRMNSQEAFKTPSVDPKWETIVKTTKPQHQHLRFSEGLVMRLAPVPET